VYFTADLAINRYDFTQPLIEISGSLGGESEDESLLGYCFM
jgi:hypothetical protein